MRFFWWYFSERERKQQKQRSLAGFKVVSQEKLSSPASWLRDAVRASWREGRKDGRTGVVKEQETDQASCCGSPRTAAQACASEWMSVIGAAHGHQEHVKLQGLTPDLWGQNSACGAVLFRLIPPHCSLCWVPLMKVRESSSMEYGRGVGWGWGMGLEQQWGICRFCVSHTHTHTGQLFELVFAQN